MKKLYFNGDIITMEGDAPRAVLTEDGIIKAVGALEEFSTVNAESIDLKGAAMLPAFIDAHSHLSAYAASFLQVRLNDCTSFSEIAAAITEFIKKNSLSKGEWVTATGYDHTLLKEGRHPVRDFLDSICPDNPLLLVHISSHMGVFNSAAMSRLNIEGSGYMEEEQFIDTMKRVPQPKSLEAAYEKAQEGYAAHGITSVQEGMFPAELIDIYKKLRGKFKPDVTAYVEPKSAAEVYSAFPKAEGRFDRGFRLGGYKIFLDGSPQAKTAWMRSPYLGSSDSGKPAMSDEAVLSAMDLAVKNKRQLLVHCNGDGAAQQMIDCAKHFPNIDRLRPVMIHAQLLAPDQLDELKRVGIMPSFFIGHIYYWGDVHLANLGEKRASHISPAGSALDKGIVFTFHQDTPVTEPDMLHSVACAVNRFTKNGVLLGSDERIPVYEALKAVTVNAAWQYFDENIRGSIRVGKRADFVILDRNPLLAPTAEIADIKVCRTIKADRVIYEK